MLHLIIYWRGVVAGNAGAKDPLHVRHGENSKAEKKAFKRALKGRPRRVRPA